MKTMFKAAVLAASMATVAAPVQAQIPFDDILVSFSNKSPNSSQIVIQSNGNAQDRVWWQKTSIFDGFSSDDSGFEFNQTPATGGIAPIGNPFSIGTFTWYNRQVNVANSLLSVNFNVAFDFGMGVSPNTYGETFTIGHVESPNVNNVNNCLYGGDNGGNTGSCRDRSIFGAGSGPSMFTYNGQSYRVDILGFGPTAGWNGTAQSTVFLNENSISNHGLYAQITAVPEPSTYALMAAGLAGVFGFARRRRTNA